MIAEGIRIILKCRFSERAYYNYCRKGAEYERDSKNQSE